MDSLKFHPDLPCPTLLRPAGGPPPKLPYSHFGCCLPAGGGQPAAVFYPLGYPTPYGPEYLAIANAYTCYEVEKLFSAETLSILELN
jgi:hypothetical protein